MVASNKSFGKSTLAGLFAVAAIGIAAPAFAATTTVTWDFFGGSSANTELKPTATFTGTESPANSLQAPLSNELGITAYGEQTTSTVTISTKYSLRIAGGYLYAGTSSTGPVSATSSADLYNKVKGSTESGLGLAAYPDHEIGDFKNTPLGSTSYSGGYDNFGYYHSNEYKTVTTSKTTYTGMIQLDLSTLLSYATGSGASVTIGSLSASSHDVADFSGSNTLGVLGTSVGTPLTYNSNSTDQTEQLSLTDLSPYEYLNIGVAGSGQSVLLSTLTLTFNSNAGQPNAAPVPASAGLTLAGALGMGMMLVARRRRSAL